MEQTETLYVWDWVGGGYNSCSAASAAEAFRKAQEIGGGVLRVDPMTFRRAREGELSALDRHYASLFS